MPLSRPFADTVRERVARDPAFAQALLDEHAAENARLRAALKEAERIARDGCLVPPDGGSPTEAEAQMCDDIADRIAALTA